MQRVTDRLKTRAKIVFSSNDQMKPILNYTIEVIDKARGKSRLYKNNKPLEIRLEGLSLVQQFQMENDAALLFLTDDSPYDEGLHIYLLESGDTLVDGIEGGAAFTPGIVKIQKTGDTWVEFQFFTNDVVYRLKISSQSRLNISLPKGWKYKKRLQKHQMKVHVVQSLLKGDSD